MIKKIKYTTHQHRKNEEIHIYLKKNIKVNFVVIIS